MQATLIGITPLLTCLHFLYIGILFLPIVVFTLAGVNDWSSSAVSALGAGSRHVRPPRKWLAGDDLLISRQQVVRYAGVPMVRLFDGE